MSQFARLTQSTARRHPLSLVAAGVVLYSTGPVFLQASEVSGPVFSFWRLWMGAPLLGLAALVGGRASGRRPDRAAWRYALWAGIAFGAHQLLFMTAIKVTSITDVTLMNTLGPVATAIGAAVMFGERPGRRFHMWTLVAIVGAAAVALGASTGPAGNPLGMAMAVANVACFAAFFLLSKKGRDHIDVLPFLFGVMLTAAVAVTGFVLVAGEAVGSASGRDLWLAFAVAAGPGAFGHFVMTWPLRWVPANIPPVMRLAIPVLAGGMAWWFLGESVTVVHLVGGAITVAGVCGAVLSRSGRELAASQRDDPAQPAEDAKRPPRRAAGDGGG